MSTSQNTQSSPIRILELRVENVKRIKAVTIRPDGAVIQITGKNGQGKSSILDSIAYALGGANTHPLKPVRDGEEGAEVVLDLGELIVRRTWNASGNTALFVTSKEGDKFSSPQQILDKLVGELAIDPLEFTRMKPKEQAETIKTLAKLDFSQLEYTRQKLYDERTGVNRDIKTVTAQLAATPQVEAPEKELHIVELTNELEVARSTNKDNDAQRDQLKETESRKEMWEGEVERYERELAAATRHLADTNDSIAKLTAAVTALKDIDIQPIKDKIATAEETNRSVRQKQQRQELADRKKALTAESEQLTKSINEADQKKEQAIAAAKIPVEGLSLSEDGVTLNGLPFEQACSSEQLKASVAIGLALNPRLRVLLVRDASLLDSEGRQILADMAEAADAQVWMERATDGEAIGIVIEDGQVQGAAAVEEQAIAE